MFLSVCLNTISFLFLRIALIVLSLHPFYHATVCTPNVISWSTSLHVSFLLIQADSHCKELEKGYEKAREKFSGVLTYFGEDPNMPCHEFFTTLSKFIQVLSDDLPRIAVMLVRCS